LKGIKKWIIVNKVDKKTAKLEPIEKVATIGATILGAAVLGRVATIKIKENVLN